MACREWISRGAIPLIKKSMEINRLYLSSALLIIYLTIITLLILKRKNLGQHIWYFITAMIIVFASEFFSTIGKVIYGDQFNSTPFMAGGVIVCFFIIVLIYLISLGYGVFNITQGRPVWIS